MTSYAQFLAAKARLAAAAGLEVDPAEVHPLLKPHQRDVVVWAVRGGRRAVFASFGLGKTFIQLEIVRLVLAKLGGGRGLIVLPLGVQQEFARDAAKLGLSVTFIRATAQASTDGIYTTNYESVRDGKVDPRGFAVVSLDEAAVLRGFGGSKTFRELMHLYEGTANYRFLATATPSPNEYIELLAYAAFLDVMDIGQAKTRFFKRDSTKADQLTLLPHMAEQFWLWVASWAMFLQRPSDLGHSDTGYQLPPAAGTSSRCAGRPPPCTPNSAAHAPAPAGSATRAGSNAPPPTPTRSTSGGPATTPAPPSASPAPRPGCSSSNCTPPRPAPRLAVPAVTWTGSPTPSRPGPRAPTRAGLTTAAAPTGPPNAAEPPPPSGTRPRPPAPTPCTTCGPPRRTPSPHPGTPSPWPPPAAAGTSTTPPATPHHHQPPPTATTTYTP
jgi:hypothetical protein